jgi:hypothetical protein
VTATLPAPTLAAVTGIGNDRFTANWNAVTGAASYLLDVATSDSFSAGSGGADVLTEDFATLTDTSVPSGWTTSGASDLDYTGAGFYGANSPAYKFKATGQWLLSPTFATGATNLQFWALGNNGSGSTFAISGLVNSVWTLIDTVSIEKGGATYNVALNPQTTQTRRRPTAPGRSGARRKNPPPPGRAWRSSGRRTAVYCSPARHRIPPESGRRRSAPAPSPRDCRPPR